MEKKMTSGFIELMRFQVERGKDLYHRAEPLLEMIEPDTRRCTCLMGAVYYRVLQKIEKRDYNIFAGRVGLSLLSKLGLVARTYLSPKPTWSRRTV